MRLTCVQETESKVIRCLEVIYSDVVSSMVEKKTVAQFSGEPVQNISSVKTHVDKVKEASK